MRQYTPKKKTKKSKARVEEEVTPSKVTTQAAPSARSPFDIPAIKKKVTVEVWVKSDATQKMWIECEQNDATASKKVTHSYVFLLVIEFSIGY